MEFRLHICKCGHEQSLHFVGEPQKSACSYCDCKQFADAKEPPEKKVAIEEDWQ